MGKSPLQRAHDIAANAKVVSQSSVVTSPKFDNYFLLHSGELFVGSGKILWKLPAGDYELEAYAFLYNQNTTKKWFSTSLRFYLGDHQRNVREGGQIAPTDEGRPMRIYFKVLTSFTKSQTIEFSFGSDASNLQVDRAQITARRIGPVKFKLIE